VITLTRTQTANVTMQRLGVRAAEHRSRGRERYLNVALVGFFEGVALGATISAEEMAPYSLLSITARELRPLRPRRKRCRLTSRPNQRRTVPFGRKTC
jgi:hypothetical protein